MKFAAVAALLFLALAACGPAARSPKSAEPAPGPGDAGPGADASLLVDAQLTEAECEKLFNHTFQIIFAAQQATRPIDERPNEADLHQAKDALRGELLAECIGASRADFPFECYMAADDLAAMKLCLGAG